MAMGRRDSDRSDAAAEAAEKLYAAPLATFTAERKRLADELKASGDIEASRTVARLGKPSVSAWVVNQLHREARDDLDALLAAGQRMRGGEMAAGRDQRAALARLHQASSEMLVRDGHAASPSMLRRVTMTLQALSAVGSFDPDPAGQLVQDRDPPGFDLLAGVTLERDDDEPRKSKASTSRSAGSQKAGKADKAGKKSDGEPARARGKDADQVIDLAARRREQREAAQRKMLEHTAAQAARRADARASEVAELRDDLERAEATAERLRTALRKAQAQLDEARAAADAAIRALDGK